MSWPLRSLLLLTSVTATNLFGCARPTTSPHTLALATSLTSSCVGEVFREGIWLSGAGAAHSVAPLPGGVSADAGRLSADGKTVVGWNPEGMFLLNVVNGSVTLLKRSRLTSDDFDLSRDASVVVWRGTDLVSGQTGLIALDLRTNEAIRISVDGTHPAISPNGKSVLFETATGIKLYEPGMPIADVSASGSWPSWSTDGSEMVYLASEGSYNAVPIRGGQMRSIQARSQAISSLQWSTDGRYAMYVRVSWGDRWLSPLSCPEQYRVVVRNMATSEDVDFYWGCTLYPERHQWINSDQLCSFRPK